LEFLPYNYLGMVRETLLQIRMSAAERKELKALANSKGLSESAMIRMLIKEAAERKKAAKA
jgi:hypothetical protein